MLCMRLVDGLRRDWLALFLILDRDEGDVERRPLIFYLSHTHTHASDVVL